LEAELPKRIKAKKIYNICRLIYLKEGKIIYENNRK